MHETEIMEVLNCKSDGNMQLMLFDDFRDLSERKRELAKQLGDGFTYRKIVINRSAKPPIGCWWFDKGPGGFCRLLKVNTKKGA